MKRLTPDTWLTIGLIVLMVVVTGAAAVWQARQEQTQPPLANFSSQRNGAKALRLWLDGLGYATSDAVSNTFRVPAGTDLALVLEPQPPINDEEWETLDTWVEDGGTLLVAGQSFGMLLAFDHYQFAIDYRNDNGADLTAQPQTPLLASPPLNPLANARPGATLTTTRDDFTTLLAVDGAPVLVTFAQGEGRVILSTLSFPLTNEGLKEAGNPQLALNLVSAATGDDGQRPSIWFDEWHHGVRGGGGEIVGPGNWLRRTPAGHAILYSVAILFLAVVLSGRRFGRPIPLPQERHRRAPLEHITAIANLKRRAGHRRAVLEQYHQQLKRGLGRRYRLSAALPDDEYVTQLAQYNPALDEAALRRLLTRLRATDVGEGEMVKLAQDVAEWLDK